jgi:hypothetical protein
MRGEVRSAFSAIDFRDRDTDQNPRRARFKNLPAEFRNCQADSQFASDARREVQFDSPLVLGDESRSAEFGRIALPENHTGSHFLHAYLNYVAVQRKQSYARNARSAVKGMAMNTDGADGVVLKLFHQ